MRAVFGVPNEGIHEAVYLASRENSKHSKLRIRSELAEIGADLEDREISESKIDPTSAPVVSGIVLWAQDKKDEKWDVIF